MKTLLHVFAVLLLPLAALAQTDVVAQGGIITSRGQGQALAISSTVIGVNSGSGVTAGFLGAVSIVTPVLSTGTLAAGGTFPAGGAVSIVVPGVSGTQLVYNGTLTTGVTWVKSKLANGTASYILSGSFTSPTGATGSFALLTSNVGAGWSGVTTVTSLNMSVN